MELVEFPCFLTTKKLVYLIDSTLLRPFFVRNKQKEIVGMDLQCEWHNDKKGVRMINRYFKRGDKVVYQDLDISSSDEEEEEDQNEM